MHTASRLSECRWHLVAVELLRVAPDGALREVLLQPGAVERRKLRVREHQAPVVHDRGQVHGRVVHETVEPRGGRCGGENSSCLFQA